MKITKYMFQTNRRRHSIIHVITHFGTTKLFHFIFHFVFSYISLFLLFSLSIWFFFSFLPPGSALEFRGRRHFILTKENDENNWVFMGKTLTPGVVWATLTRENDYKEFSARRSDWILSPTITSPQRHRFFYNYRRCFDVEISGNVMAKRMEFITIKLVILTGTRRLWTEQRPSVYSIPPPSSRSPILLLGNFTFLGSLIASLVQIPPKQKETFSPWENENVCAR